MRKLTLVASGLVLVASCASTASDIPSPAAEATRTTAPVLTTNPTTFPPTTIPPPPLDVVDVPAAIAISVASNGIDDPVIAWSDPEAVRIARLNLSDFELGPPIVASGSVTPIAHVIERPAISVGADNVVHLAFTSFDGANGSVFYVDGVEDEPNSPIRISGDPRHETNLPHMTLNDQEPALAWLEDSSLSVAIEREGTHREFENVDELTCDCCNPVPVRSGNQLTVLYRNLEHSSDGVIRDIFAITALNADETFQDPVLISDDHWFLDGCPFSGPTAVLADETLIVSWMDARQSLHPDQRTTTIWVDRSSDGGARFGTDVAITDGGLHRWPSLTIDGTGIVHLVWETQTSEGGISYSSAPAPNATFSPPSLLIPNSEDSGSRRAPTVIAHGDYLLITWIDSTGGHVARFDLPALP